ncbi:MAG TPA: hypothetical protein VF783_10430, partial [Terriglobales bacterium]
CGSFARNGDRHGSDGVGWSATKPMPATMPTNMPCHATGVNPEFVMISRPPFTNAFLSSDFVTMSAV